jgi:hypothetical protein
MLSFPDLQSPMSSCPTNSNDQDNINADLDASHIVIQIILSAIPFSQVQLFTSPALRKLSKKALKVAMHSSSLNVASSSQK